MDEDGLPPLKRPRLRPRGRKPSKCTFNYVDDPSVKTPPVQATVQEEVNGDQLSLHDHSLHARQQVGSVDIQPNSVTSAGEQEALNQDGSDEVVTTSAPMSSGNRDSQSASRRPVSTSSIVSGTPVKSARQQGERHSRAEQVIRTTVEKPSCHMQLRSATRKIASHDQNSRIIPDRLEMRNRPTKQALNVTSPLQRTLRIMSPQSGPSFRIPDTSLDSTCLTTSAPMPECDSPCTVHLIGKKRTAKDVTELDVLLTHMEDVFSDFKQSLNDPRYVAAIDDVLNIVQSEFSKAIAKENEMKLFQSKIHLAEVHLQRDRKKLLSLQQKHVSALHYLKKIEGELKVLQRSQSRLFISQYFSALSSFIHTEVAKSSTLTNQKSKASLKCNNKR